jgi:16S rRNA (adenine1518-N6/adenine1519-N6)-dimethyltransferase
MADIGSKSKTKELIKTYDFHIKKQFGQNFLTDANILRKIVQQANVDSDTLVVEIGPGMGALTEVLLANAKHVLAYEIDTTLIPILTNSFADQPFTLIEGNVLERNIDQDIKQLQLDASRIILVANLPYYITTPIIMKLLEESTFIQEYYVMMQLEVARRFTSKPRTKDYNSLSVFIQFKTTSSVLMKVPKQVFIPAPNVDSAIVKMVIKDQFERFPVNEQLFYDLVRASFSMRRKTLVNNLQPFLNISKMKLSEHLEELGFKSTVRAEELTVDEFITLSDYFAQI